MRIPDSLISLAEEGIIEEVLRPLMSGKEAQIYLLRSGGEERVAKVYKNAQERSFKQRSEYTEGRKVRNSRDQRAMTKRSRHGRDQDEAAWRAAEVDMIYRLHAAGVRVPTPYQFIDGVLIMELITDGEGNPAPRLGDVSLDRETASEIYDHLLREVVRMLCAGVVHGDLSDFNVLMGPDGPVIIDFPQAVNASSNQNARKLLLRDVDNLHRFLTRFVPERRPLPYAEEMWQLYQRGELTPDAKLSGRYRASEAKANTDVVLGLIADAERDERRRRSGLGLSMRGTTEQPAEASHNDAARGRRAEGGGRSMQQGAPLPPRPTPQVQHPRGTGDARSHARGGQSGSNPHDQSLARNQARGGQQPQPRDQNQARTPPQPQPRDQNQARTPQPAQPHGQGRHKPRRDAGRAGVQTVVVQTRRPLSLDPNRSPAIDPGRADSSRDQQQPARFAAPQPRPQHDAHAATSAQTDETAIKRKRRRRRRRSGGPDASNANQASAAAPTSTPKRRPDPSGSR